MRSLQPISSCRPRFGASRLRVPAIGVGLFLACVGAVVAWNQVAIDVPSGHVAVLTRKVGEDIENDSTVAPDENHKGIQLKVLNEGRYFYSPWSWDWEVYPMIDIPQGKMGVRVRLHGENLPYGHFLAVKESQKGIVPEILPPGRYPINAVVRGQEAARRRSDYVEMVELYEPISVPAGYRGVVTNLAGPIAENPNTLLSEKGNRGVQKETLDAGTYYLNPYAFRVNLVDCRSQRFNLADNVDMGFPSIDGFWVSLDGVIEFRVDPKKAAEVYVTYNETLNDKEGDSAIHDEIVRKIITPNARSFCRLRGSDKKGRDFIGGETRSAFQKDFQVRMQEACQPVGIEIVQALITKINPPQAIALPVRQREVARQKMLQYKEQKIQQDAEAKLATEKAMIVQRQDLVKAEQEVNQKVTEAKQKQQVAITGAMEKKAIASEDLIAAKDTAAATASRKKAEATLVEQANEAEAAGWRKATEAFGGDGDAYARLILYQKLAPAYRSMMANTADSPLMDVFKNMAKPSVVPTPAAPPAVTKAAPPEPKVEPKPEPKAAPSPAPTPMSAAIPK